MMVTVVKLLMFICLLVFLTSSLIMHSAWVVLLCINILPSWSSLYKLSLWCEYSNQFLKATVCLHISKKNSSGITYCLFKKLNSQPVSPVLLIIQRSCLYRLIKVDNSHPFLIRELTKTSYLTLTAFSAASTVSYSTKACNYSQKKKLHTHKYTSACLRFHIKQVLDKKFLTLVVMYLSFLQPFPDSSTAFGSQIDTLFILQFGKKNR